jgi:Tol biopolymer transport system component
MIRRLAGRGLGLGLACLALLLSGPIADVLSAPADQQVPAGVAGRIVLPRTRALVQVAAANGTEEQLLPGAPLTTITQASWSPDGGRIAYSLFRFWRPERPAGSDLMVVDANGQGGRVVLGALDDDTSFTEPVWSADGAHLVYGTVIRIPGSALGETRQQVERVEVATGQRRVLVSDGFSPALSRDGRNLAFVRTTGPSQSQVSLWLAEADGANPRVLFNDSRFTNLAFPRFAPSGDRLAFAAVGGPVAVPRALGHGLPLLAPGVAFAHGEPWDLWEIRTDGSGLRRLTELAEDDPALTWSPDGRWIAFNGGSGLHLLDTSSTGLYRLSAVAGFGGMDWTR